MAKPQSSTSTITRDSGPPPPRSWADALADYRAKKATSDAIPLDDKRCDDAVDDYCRAMDYLVESVPAPNLPAVITKLELMKERFQMFDQPATGAAAVMADLKRLASASPTSLILALHARYEAAWEEYNRIDEAKPAKDKATADVDSADGIERFRDYYACERGMGESSDETEAIRQLILRQVPSTDEELSVVMFHLWSAFEPENGWPLEEQKAFAVGLTNTFDYLVGEGRADMERLGKQFHNGAMLAWGQRRYRTGQMDD